MQRLDLTEQEQSIIKRACKECDIKLKDDEEIDKDLLIELIEGLYFKCDYQDTQINDLNNEIEELKENGGRYEED